MEQEKETTNKKSLNFNWLLLLIALGLLVYLFYFQKEEIQVDSDNLPVAEFNDKAEGAGEIPSGNINRPQYSEENPRPESVDPFTPNFDFEMMMNSNDNKTDFDFSFENQKEVPTYSLNNGIADFELKGTLKTAAVLENKIPLALEVYTNDQISMTKRKVKHTYDLSFIKEAEKKKSKDKISYSFDFKQAMPLDPGLHYFLIVPVGRNRILYTGKFVAK